MDIFDPIRHTGFDQLPLTRAERVNNVKKRGHFTKYSKQARNMLEVLLDKYANKGIENMKDMKDMKILQVNLLNQFGSTVEIAWPFGGKTQYQQALMELEREIYRAA